MTTELLADNHVVGLFISPSYQYQSFNILHRKSFSLSNIVKLNYFLILKNLHCLFEDLFYCFLFATKCIDILQLNVQLGTLRKLEYALLTMRYKTFRKCLAYSLDHLWGYFRVHRGHSSEIFM